MAIQCADVARQAVAQLGLDAGYELAAQFVGETYAELTSRAKFRHLRKFRHPLPSSPDSDWHLHSHL